MGRPQVSSFRDDVPRGVGSVRGCCLSLPQEASTVWWHGGGALRPLYFYAHTFGKTGNLHYASKNTQKKYHQQTTNFPLLSNRSVSL